MIDAEFLHNPSGKDMFCHCPSILETQSGTLMVVWYVYPEDEHSGATLALVNKKHDFWSLAESILAEFIKTSWYRAIQRSGYLYLSGSFSISNASPHGPALLPDEKAW